MDEEDGNVGGWGGLWVVLFDEDLATGSHVNGVDGAAHFTCVVGRMSD